MMSSGSGEKSVVILVEARQNWPAMKSMGVDFVQGYLLHRPAPLPV